MDAAVAALVGASIGAIGSSAAVFVTQWFQDRRDRLKAAIDLGIEEYRVDIDLAKQVREPVRIAPLSAHVICSARMLDGLATGRITPDKIKEPTRQRNDLLAAFPGWPGNQVQD